MNPTRSQIEAYRLVYLQQLTQASAAAFMGISQPAISQHLSKLRHIAEENITPPVTVTYVSTMDYMIERKF